ADAILVLLTPEEGRVDAVVRGVRRSQAKLRGHVEPVTRSRLLLARGRSLEVVAQAQTVDAYLAIKADLEALAAAIYLCELVEQVAVAQTPQRELYSILADALAALDAGMAPDPVARYFELHLLAISGHELQVVACASCGADLSEADALFSAAAGGILCAQCRSNVPGRLLSVRAQKVLRFARRAGLEAFCSLRIPPEIGDEIRTALREAIRSVLDSEPRSVRFLDRVTFGE
ncbi:MAG: DNA repair protein RecO, partial [Chloroflexota bacterium]